eukprot:6636758-Pyramimonas_sp.AAC.1
MVGTTVRCILYMESSGRIKISLSMQVAHPPAGRMVCSTIIGDETTWPKQQKRSARYNPTSSLSCQRGNPVATAASKSQ